MREFSPNTAAYFAQVTPIRARILIWISARDRSTGAVETIGFWTGEDHQVFSIGGVNRTYYGAGDVLSVDPIRRSTGLQVHSQRVSLSQVSEPVAQAVRGYDPRHAPVEIHRALFDPLSGGLVDEPHVLFRGFVDKLTISTPAKGESGSITMEIASQARALTKALSRYRSNATLIERAPTDTFRKYSARTDKVEVPWGSGKERGAASDTPPRGNPSWLYGHGDN